MAKYRTPYDVDGWPTPAVHLHKYPDMSVEQCLRNAEIYGADQYAVAWWWEAAALAKRVYDE